MLTPENDFKPQFVQPRRGVFAFEEGDTLVHFAEANGMQMHARTLVWFEALPAWMRAEMTHDYTNGNLGVRPHLWFEAMGEHYIAPGASPTDTAPRPTSATIPPTRETPFPGTRRTWRNPRTGPCATASTVLPTGPRRRWLRLAPARRS